MVEGLVNLITPAYNSAGFIFRLLNSVLNQTYPKIKMYIVDDGSTDNTREVIREYIPLFEQKGYELMYLHQENSGLSVAINRALKLVDGEFLLWPDSDDWYKEPESIEKLVSVLQNYGDEVGIARCRREFVDELTFAVKRTSFFTNYGVPESVLEDAVYLKNGFEWSPGCHIIKTKFLEKFIPGRNIYTEKEAGQNYQLIIPYIANSKCVSIEDVLFCYLERKDSHCRASGFEKEKNRVKAYAWTWVNVFDNLYGNLDVNMLDQYKRYGLNWMYPRLLKNDVDYKKTSSFRHHIKECNRWNIPLTKRYRKLGLWTKLFGLRSYLMISESHSKLRNFVCRRHDKLQSNG